MLLSTEFIWQVTVDNVPPNYSSSSTNLSLYCRQSKTVAAAAAAAAYSQICVPSLVNTIRTHPHPHGEFSACASITLLHIIQYRRPQLAQVKQIFNYANKRITSPKSQMEYDFVQIQGKLIGRKLLVCTHTHIHSLWLCACNAARRTDHNRGKSADNVRDTPHPTF